MKPRHSHLIRELDLSAPAEIERFERAFYEGFAHATHNRLVRSLWDWDHEARRLRTRILYSDQRAWALVNDDGAFDAALSVNVRLRTLQCAAYGFALPPELVADAAAGHVCEFLTFFAVGDRSLSSKHALLNTLIDDLCGTGITHALATTAPKALPMYRYLGVRIIGEAHIEGEIRYFLQFDAASRSAKNGATRARALTSAQIPRSPSL